MQDRDRDAFVLPGNDHVYLTQNKDGKPALGRKKPGRLLQDFGFDMLGQSFGVPSRKDYENQARPLSAASQSSGLVTAPVTPRPDREARPSNKNHQMYTYEDTESPVVRRGTSSIRSSSTPAPTAMAQRHRQDASKSQQHTADKRNHSLQWPQMFNQPHVPPPPPPPPPPSVMGWHNPPVPNIGMAPIPISYYSPAHHPGYHPGYPYNSISIPQGAQIWANPQYYAGAQRPNAPEIVLPQTSAQISAMPMLPNHQQFSQSQPAQTLYMQTIPATHLANIPPPPPPPPLPLQQNWLPARAIATNRGKPSHQNKVQVGRAETITNQANQTRNDSKSAKLTHEKPFHSEDVKQTLSKRIRHAHVCGGCGKKRSIRYQKAHPLRRGEIPALNYCYSCLKDAADTDDGASDGDNADGSHAPTGGKYTDERSRRDPRGVKKSTRIGSLSRLFSYRAAPNPPPRPPKSISSAEESSSRASSPGLDLDEINSIYKPAMSPNHHDYENTNNRTTQDEVEMPALPPQRYARVDSLNSKHNSPLVPREVGLDKAKQEGKERVKSNKKPTLPRPRTRIPRPKRQSETVDSDPSLSRNAHDPAPVHDSKPVSRRSDTSGAKGVVPMPQSAGIGLISKSSNHVIPEDAHKFVKQKYTRASIKRGEKSQVFSSEDTSTLAVSSDNRGRNIRASMKDSLGTPVAVPSKVILKGSVDKPTKYTDHGCYSAERHILSNCNSEIDTEQTAGLYRDPSSENSARRPFNSNLSKRAGESGVAFDWYDPSTPNDAPYASISHSPRIVSDSWSEYQTDIEREAEEMAEHDLASAGKLFDSLSDSLGGSATSAFPLSSFVTTSNMSIVSYNSDSDRSGSDIAFVSTKEARIQKTPKTIEANKPTRRIGMF